MLRRSRCVQTFLQTTTTTPFGRRPSIGYGHNIQQISRNSCQSCSWSAEQENMMFPRARSRLRTVSRDGSAIPSCVSPLILSTQTEFGVRPGIVCMWCLRWSKDFGKDVCYPHCCSTSSVALNVVTVVQRFSEDRCTLAELMLLKEPPTPIESEPTMDYIHVVRCGVFCTRMTPA